MIYCWEREKMAEQVQEALDQMVAPLRDLVDRHIFTETEVKAIVSRRRESEYLLRRRAARKADFLRYIEAEEVLEELRQVRTEQQKRDHRKSHQRNHGHQNDDDDDNSDDDENGPPKKSKEATHIGDTHIMQHIHLLFVRAIRKFRSDLSLYLLHVDFCKKHKCWTRLSKVYAEALQIFPRKEGLWIESASHEFFGPRRSVRNARILMQRGLRINATSQDLWVEYFSLELHYAQTLRGRRQILIKGGGRFEEEEVLDDKEDDNEVDQLYKIAAIVYKNAIKAIPASIPFRLRFLDTCRRFPKTHNLMHSIQESLQQDFGSQPEAWIARALYEAEKMQQQGTSTTTKMDQAAKASQDKEKEGAEHDEDSSDDDKNNRPLKKPRSKDPVVYVLEEGLERVNSEEMKLQAFRFAQRYLDEQDERGDRVSVQQTQELIHRILQESSEQITSPDLALEQAEYFISRGDEEKAAELLEKFCTNSSPDRTTIAPASLWIRWASLYPEKDPKAKRILKKSLDRIPITMSDHLLALLQYFGCLLKEEETEKSLLNDTFQRILILAPTAMNVMVENVDDYWFGIVNVAQAYTFYLKHNAKVFGINSARRVYQSVLFHSSVQINESNINHITSFIDDCLQLEQSNKPQLRRLYDQILQLLQGTTLEKKYREDRNNLVIYN